MYHRKKVHIPPATEILFGRCCHHGNWVCNFIDPVMHHPLSSAAICFFYYHRHAVQKTTQWWLTSTHAAVMTNSPNVCVWHERDALLMSRRYKNLTSVITSRRERSTERQEHSEKIDCVSAFGEPNLSKPCQHMSHSSLTSSYLDRLPPPPARVRCQRRESMKTAAAVTSSDVYVGGFKSYNLTTWVKWI